MNTLNEIIYRRNGDYLIPSLCLDDMSGDIGKYGRLRKAYLQNHRPGVYSGMVVTGKLWPHLMEMNEMAQDYVDRLVAEMAERDGVNEELKAADPMEWVGRMNGLVACAEEVVLDSVIYI